MARRRKKQTFSELIIELAVKLMFGSLILLVINYSYLSKNGFNIGGSWLNPLLILIIILVAVGLGIYLASIKIKLERANIQEIDKMSGGTFERYLEQFFKKRGWKVKRIGGSGDYGADLILESAARKVIVQAKRWKKNVGYEAIQQAHTAKDIYGANEAWVITNSYYTDQAREGARKLGVILWDRDKLIEQMAAVHAAATIDIAEEESSLHVEEETEKDSTIQKTKPISRDLSIHRLNINQVKSECAICKKPVTEKVKLYCLANPSRFYGKVLCYDHQRFRR